MFYKKEWGACAWCAQWRAHSGKIISPFFQIKKTKKTAYVTTTKPYIIGLFVCSNCNTRREKSKMIQTGNSKKHYSKKEKQDREQTKNILTNKEINLQPAKYLNEQGKEYFEYLTDIIKDSEIPFDSIDEVSLNLLAENLYQAEDAIKNIHENGVMLSDGKKNQATAVFNSVLKNIDSLLTSLNLTMNQRVKTLLANVQNQNIDDPFKDVIDND